MPNMIECRVTAVNKGCDECRLCGVKGEKSQVNIGIPAHGILAQVVERKVAKREAAAL